MVYKVIITNTIIIIILYKTCVVQKKRSVELLLHTNELFRVVSFLIKFYVERIVKSTIYFSIEN